MEEMRHNKKHFLLAKKLNFFIRKHIILYFKQTFNIRITDAYFVLETEIPTNGH